MKATKSNAIQAIIEYVQADAMRQTTDILYLGGEPLVRMPWCVDDALKNAANEVKEVLEAEERLADQPPGEKE